MVSPVAVAYRSGHDAPNAIVQLKMPAGCEFCKVHVHAHGDTIALLPAAVPEDAAGMEGFDDETDLAGAGLVSVDLELPRELREAVRRGAVVTAMVQLQARAGVANTHPIFPYLIHIRLSNLVFGVNTRLPV